MSGKVLKVTQGDPVFLKESIDVKKLHRKYWESAEL
jgi:hypothetical protein